MGLLKISAEWDEEAKVWVATSDDVPGLAIEASTMDALIERLKIVIPELMEMNTRHEQSDFPFELNSYFIGSAHASCCH